MSNRDHLLEAMQRYIEGQLSLEDIDSLERAMIEDATLRRKFLDLLNLDSAVHQVVSADSSSDDVLLDEMAGLQAEIESATADASRPTLPEVSLRKPNSPILDLLGEAGRSGWGWIYGHSVLFTLATLLLIAVSAGGGWIVGSNWQTTHSAQVAAVARIQNAQNCVWARGAAPGDLVAGSSLLLESGLLELHFVSGAEIVLHGPARLELASANAARLLQGKLAAHVSPQACGFQVFVPGGKVIDLGTEFGVSVEGDGNAKVVVFQGNVEAYSNHSEKRPLNLGKDQVAYISSSGVSRNPEKADSNRTEFVRAIVPPPVVVPRVLALDFRRPVAGSLQDRAGSGIGLTHRMPGTGSLLGKNDENLWLDTRLGQLQVTTTETDINGLYQLGRGEYFGVRLADLGFAESEDFEVTATFLNSPVLDGFNQFGLYAGTGSRQNVRGGMIGFAGAYIGGNNGATQFIVNHEDKVDKQINSVGVYKQGSDVVLTLRRIGGRYSLTSENRTTGESVTVTTTPPTFLKGALDMHAGIFGANTRTKETRILFVKSLKVTVWTTLKDGRPNAQVDRRMNDGR